MRMNRVFIGGLAILLAACTASAQGRRGDQQNPGTQQPGRGTPPQTQTTDGAQTPRRTPPPGWPTGRCRPRAQARDRRA